ncbi:hypothetical protein, partial [Clostridium culturomicium]|uniref:hypothetical protein n=1 Tax=Clostridium culturomicium TaxID=1499683 RepID=UPI0005903D32
FDEIYKELERITGEKPRKVSQGIYVNNELREAGFTKVQLTNKKINSKYKYNFMQITITLNPVKLLRGNKLDVIELDRVEEFKELFDEEVKKIHESLPRLDYWVINRIDYAININTPYVKEYIKLFQRADKPRSFKELYCSHAKIRKQKEGSFYLYNDSVAINFYDKESERLSQNFNLDGAKDLLRLEVQCKKPKTNSIKTKEGFATRHLKHYLSQDLSSEILDHYYNKTIGTGDYYKLTEAIKMVKESKHTSKTQEKLIGVMKAVSKHRSIWKAREQSEYNPSCFNLYLKKIRELGINPVTIPLRWEINKLKNLIG